MAHRNSDERKRTKFEGTTVKELADFFGIPDPAHRKQLELLLFWDVAMLPEGYPEVPETVTESDALAEIATALFAALDRLNADDLGKSRLIQRMGLDVVVDAEDVVMRLAAHCKRAHVAPRPAPQNNYKKFESGMADAMIKALFDFWSETLNRKPTFSYREADQVPARWDGVFGFVLGALEVARPNIPKDKLSRAYVNSVLRQLRKQRNRQPGSGSQPQMHDFDQDPLIEEP